MQLRWILPVVLLASGVLAAWLALRMMRNGIKQAAANPEFQKALREAAAEAKPSDQAGTE